MSVLALSQAEGKTHEDEAMYVYQFLLKRGEMNGTTFPFKIGVPIQATSWWLKKRRVGTQDYLTSERNDSRSTTRKRQSVGKTAKH